MGNEKISQEQVEKTGAVGGEQWIIMEVRTYCASAPATWRLCANDAAFMSTTWSMAL